MPVHVQAADWIKIIDNATDRFLKPNVWYSGISFYKNFSSP